MTNTEARVLGFNARGLWLMVPIALVIASAGCDDKVGCAANEASCGNNGGPATAPTTLAFTRRTATTGDFSWTPVAGATSYALYLNGAEATTTTTTTAALEIGDGDADVQVAAVNRSGRSPKSGSFPVLFDVSLRACASDTVEARWRTAKDTDTWSTTAARATFSWKPAKMRTARS